MAGKAVAKNDVAELPDLVPTPAMDIGADDVALGRLKIGQHMSPQVTDTNAKYGDIYSVMSKEDGDPQIVWEFGKEEANGQSENKDKGLLFHVLDMYRGRSLETDGVLTLFDYNDPAAPPDAWITYNYFLCIPALDDYLPIKYILTKTGRQAAQQMNTVLKRTAERGPMYLNAFELTAKKTSNDKGKYCVPIIRQVEATEETVRLASDMTLMMQGRPDIKANNMNVEDEPGI